MEIAVVPTLFNSFGILIHKEDDTYEQIDVHPTTGTPMSLSEAESLKNSMENPEPVTKMNIFDKLVSEDKFRVFSQMNNDIAKEYQTEMEKCGASEYIRMKQALMLKLIMASDFELTDNELFVVHEMFEEYGLEDLL